MSTIPDQGTVALATLTLNEFDEIEGVDRLCKLGRVAKTLEQADQDTLYEHLDGEYRHTTFVEWFARRQIEISEHTIRTHRHGKCCCGR